MCDSKTLPFHTDPHAHRGGKKQEMILVLRERCYVYGPEALTLKELTHLVRDRASLQWLNEQAWCASPDSYWGLALHRHIQQPVTPS